MIISLNLDEKYLELLSSFEKSHMIEVESADALNFDVCFCPCNTCQTSPPVHTFFDSHRNN